MTSVNQQKRRRPFLRKITTRTSVVSTVVHHGYLCWIFVINPLPPFFFTVSIYTTFPSNSHSVLLLLLTLFLLVLEVSSTVVVNRWVTVTGILKSSKRERVVLQCLTQKKILVFNWIKVKFYCSAIFSHILNNVFPGTIIQQINRNWSFYLNRKSLQITVKNTGRKGCSISFF